jgi:hypothetical protein
LSLSPRRFPLAIPFLLYHQVRPVADESQLADLPTLPFSSLRPEFRRDVESLRKRILTSVRVKTVFGKEGEGITIRCEWGGLDTCSLPA